MRIVVAVLEPRIRGVQLLITDQRRRDDPGKASHANFGRLLKVSPVVQFACGSRDRYEQSEMMTWGYSRSLAGRYKSRIAVAKS